jgi:asparagine synthase (glutamine-hydrolysing)
MTEEFVELVKKNQKTKYNFVGQPCRTIRKDMLYWYHYGHISTRIESWETGTRANCLEYRYPLLDKRLLEFVVGIPGDFFEKDGTGRYLFKKAIQDLISSDILWHTTKLEPQRVQRLLDFAPELFKRIKESPELDRRSCFINTKRFKNSIDALKKYNGNLDTDRIQIFCDIEVLWRLFLSENKQCQ